MRDRTKTEIDLASPEASPMPAPASSGSRRRRRQLTIAGVVMAMAVVLIGASWLMVLHVGAQGKSAASELASFQGHESAVRCLAISADGELVASGDEQGSLLIWNARNREQLGRLAGHTASVDCVSISLDRKWAASGDDDGAIRIWDIEKFSETAHSAAHRGAVTSVLVYPAQSHLLSSGRDGRIVLWQLTENPPGKDCKPIKECSVGSAEVTCLAMTPDGVGFLSGDTTGTLTLWQLATMREVCRFNAHRGAVRGVSISPLGGRALSCGDDGVVRLWDLEHQRLAATGKTHDETRQWAVAFSPGATRALSTDAHGIVRLWSPDQEQVIESYSGHSAAATCAVFFPNGTVGLTGSLDHSIRLWQLPPPSIVEAKQTAEAFDAMRRRGERYLKFGKQMELARQSLEKKQPEKALTEFRAAEASVSGESLEYKIVHEVATELATEIRAMQDYATLCQAGKIAAEKEDFDEAMKKFQQAREVIRGRSSAAEHHEAEQGYDESARLRQLKQALEKLEVTHLDLDFVQYAPEREPLEKGRQFVFLLKRSNPPMALATTPLEWTIDLETSVPFPDEKVSLKVELWHEASGRRMAEVTHAFVVGASEQSFRGEARPPAGGWLAGNYQLRSTLVTPRKEIVRDPQDVKMGLLQWTESKIELEPAAVQKAGYVVDAGVKLERGDALLVSAEGTVAPAPLAFYRELLVEPKRTEPLPTKPTGLPWVIETMRLRKYQVVDLKANFAALVLRIGVTGPWLAYRDHGGAQLVPESGPLQVSINSVVPASFSPAVAPKPPTASEQSYWAANSGSYKVTILRGQFDFPIPLSNLQRVALLQQHFKN
jgi:WD40 repeat protein